MIATRRRRHRREWALALVVASLLIGGCGQDDPETVVEEAQEEDFQELVVDQPFEGTAVVSEVVSPHAFKLFDTLVVSRQRLEVEVDERVRVRGMVRSASVEELEDQLGVELADAVADAHDGGLLVVADEVRPVEFPGPE
ncbi:MAG TPA: hypothetical protein VGR26_09735 [Acidimicrobiales bacterium]|nr:hypothetical protein [Acidimicrobiales bacterium]